MKKIMYGIIFLSLITIGFVSCDKDSIESIEDEKTAIVNKKLEGIYSNGELLVFETYKDFETVVQMPTPEIEAEFMSKVSTMDHTSYGKAKALAKNKVDLVKDAYLAQILNKDLAVQIGDWIYRVNKPTEKVYALSVKNASDYNDLIAENIKNPNILQFSTEENVIELLETKLDFGEKALRKDCQSSKQESTGWKEYADWVDENGIYGHAGRRYKFNSKMKVRYDNWGIYRKLFAEFEHKESLWGTWDETHFSMQVYGSYKVRNGSTGNYSLFPTYQIYGTWRMNSTSDDFYDFLDDKKELQIYRGTKCLSEFELRGWSIFRNKETRNPRLAPNDGSGVYILGN